MPQLGAAGEAASHCQPLRTAAKPLMNAEGSKSLSLLMVRPSGFAPISASFTVSTTAREIKNLATLSLASNSNLLHFITC